MKCELLVAAARGTEGVECELLVAAARGTEGVECELLVTAARCTKGVECELVAAARGTDCMHTVEMFYIIPCPCILPVLTVFLLLADLLPPDADAEPDIRRGPLQDIQQHPDHSNSS